MALSEILRVLRDAYCRTIGIEYMHIQDLDEQHWIQEQVESQSQQSLDTEDQRYILERLNAAEAFERFLGTKWIGQKRFGIEGSESLIPILDAILEAAADDHLAGSVMGMPHRGRLNVLTNIVGKNYDQVFKEFEGTLDPTAVQGSGDVKYHLGQVGKFQSRAGNEIDVELAANPSHLEAVDPVVEGMARARQDQINDPEAFSVLPILMHGDAAFAGQGVVAETLNMSDIKGYRVGGTIHIVVNNQIGFTTTPEAARSGFYSTDAAKIVQAPIFHVNGDDPEACVRVARLAYAYRQRFHKDVVIDLVSYRRYGHNEGDDPSYTQPLMYAKIDDRRSVRKLFTESLVKRGQLTLEEAEQALDDYQKRLQQALDETRQSSPPANLKAAEPAPAVGVLPRVECGVDRAVLDRIYDTLSGWPDDFNVHPKLARQFETRDKMVRGDGEVDWATAEALAFGSLLLEGTDIRLAGQDTRRGTFSQRHAVLVDHVDRPGVGAAGPSRAGAGEVLDLRLAAVGVRGGGLRVRLLGGQQGGPGGVGGPVRRLRQRGQHDHRPVPGGRRGQVEPDVGARAAPAPRLRGPGPRAQLGPPRAVPHAVRRGQHPGRQRHHRRPVLPPAAPADGAGRAQAARRLHAQVAAAGQARPLADRGADQRLVPRGARRPPGRRPRGRAPHRAVLGQGRARRRWPSATSATRRWRSCGSSSSTRGRTSSSTRSWPATRRPARSCGSRRSRPTWAPGPSPRTGWPRSSPRATPSCG